MITFPCVIRTVDPECPSSAPDGTHFPSFLHMTNDSFMSGAAAAAKTETVQRCGMLSLAHILIRSLLGLELHKVSCSVQEVGFELSDHKTSCYHILSVDWHCLTSSFEAPCATSAVVAMSAAIMAGSISSSPSPDIIFSMICKWKIQGWFFCQTCFLSYLI